MKFNLLESASITGEWSFIIVSWLRHVLHFLVIKAFRASIKFFEAVSAEEACFTLSLNSFRFFINFHIRLPIKGLIRFR